MYFLPEIPSCSNLNSSGKVKFRNEFDFQLIKPSEHDHVALSVRLGEYGEKITITDSTSPNSAVVSQINTSGLLLVFSNVSGTSFSAQSLAKAGYWVWRKEDYIFSVLDAGCDIFASIIYGSTYLKHLSLDHVLLKLEKT